MPARLDPDGEELDDDVYMVDCILAEKEEGGVAKYLIQWYTLHVLHGSRTFD